MTVTLSATWQIGLGTPNAGTATTLVNVGQISEALPPLVLTSFPLAPTGALNNDYSTVLQTALDSGYDRILIDGPPSEMILNEVYIRHSCELIFGKNLTIIPIAPADNDNVVQDACFVVNADNVTIRGLVVVGQPMLPDADGGSGANLTMTISGGMLSNPITIEHGQGGSGYLNGGSGPDIIPVYDNASSGTIVGSIKCKVVNGSVVSAIVDDQGIAYSDGATAIGSAYPLNVIKVYPTSGSMIENFTLLDCSFTNCMNGLYTSYATNIRVERCYASGYASGGSAFGFLAPNGGWVKDCHAAGGSGSLTNGSGFRLTGDEANDPPLPIANFLFTNCIAENYVGGNGFDGNVGDLYNVTYAGCVARNNDTSQFEIKSGIASSLNLGVRRLQYIGCIGSSNLDNNNSICDFFRNPPGNAGQDGNDAPFEVFVDGGSFYFENDVDAIGNNAFRLVGVTGGLIAPSIGWAGTGVVLIGPCDGARIRPQNLFARQGVSVPAPNTATPSLSPALREVDLSGGKIRATAAGVIMRCGSNPVLHNANSSVQGRRLSKVSGSGPTGYSAVTATLSAMASAGDIGIGVSNTAGLQVGALPFTHTSAFPSGGIVSILSSAASTPAGVLVFSPSLLANLASGATVVFQALQPIYVNGGGVGLIFAMPVVNGALSGTPVVLNPGQGYLGGTITSTVGPVPVPGANPVDPGSGGAVYLVISGGAVSSITLAAGGSNYLNGASGTYLPKIGEGANVIAGIDSSGNLGTIYMKHGGWGFVATPNVYFPAPSWTSSFTVTLDEGYGLELVSIAGGQVSGGRYQGETSAIYLNTDSVGAMITGVTAVCASNPPIASDSSSTFQGDRNRLVTRGFASTPALTIADSAITIGLDPVRVAPSSTPLQTINGALADGQVIHLMATSPGGVTVTDSGNILLSGGTVALSSSNEILMLQWSAKQSTWLQVAAVTADS